MRTTESIRYVEAGEPQRVWCEGCLSDSRWETGLYALDGSGPVLVYVLFDCENCGDGLGCAYCPALLPFSGRRAFEHTRDVHAEDG